MGVGFRLQSLTGANIEMTQDTQQQSYRGVKCLNCKEPIPISPLVAGIEAELRDAEHAPTKHRKCQVFHLRCVICGKEKPYKIGEILEFEGMPATLSSHAEPRAAYVNQSANRSRAANA